MQNHVASMRAGDPKRLISNTSNRRACNECAIHIQCTNSTLAIETDVFLDIFS